MSLKISKEVRIGILVIVTIGLFILGYGFLKGKRVFSSTKSYYVVYDRVGGLSESSHVFLSGYRIGYVEDIRFMEDMQHLQVTIRIDGKVSLAEGTQAKVFSSDIMGTRAVQLIQGNAPGVHTPGDTLVAGYEPDLVDEVKELVTPLTTRAEGMLASLDSVLMIFQVMLDDEFRGNFASTMSNLNTTVGSLRQSVHAADTMLTDSDSRINRIIDNLASISGNLEAGNEDIGKILNNFASVSDSLAQSELMSSINQLNELMEGINQGEGSLGKLATDKELYNNLENASHNLDLLLIELRENPGRFVHFSIFGRRRE